MTNLSSSTESQFQYDNNPVVIVDANLPVPSLYNHFTEFSVSASVPNGNAVNARTIARKSGSSSQFGHFNIAELSEWSVVLDQDTIDALYNSGSGQAIY